MIGIALFVNRLRFNVYLVILVAMQYAPNEYSVIVTYALRNCKYDIIFPIIELRITKKFAQKM